MLFFSQHKKTVNIGVENVEIKISPFKKLFRAELNYEVTLNDQVSNCIIAFQVFVKKSVKSEKK